MAYATGLVPAYTIKNEAFAGRDKRNTWATIAYLLFVCSKYFY
jgi:hypothetical protein